MFVNVSINAKGNLSHDRIGICNMIKILSKNQLLQIKCLLKCFLLRLSEHCINVTVAWKKKKKKQTYLSTAQKLFCLVFRHSSTRHIQPAFIFFPKWFLMLFKSSYLVVLNFHTQASWSYSLIQQVPIDISDVNFIHQTIQYKIYKTAFLKGRL